MNLTRQKNYVPLPKGIYRIGLSGEEISVYGYGISFEKQGRESWEEDGDQWQD